MLDSSNIENYLLPELNDKDQRISDDSFDCQENNTIVNENNQNKAPDPDESYNNFYSLSQPINNENANFYGDVNLYSDSFLNCNVNNQIDNNNINNAQIMENNYDHFHNNIIQNDNHKSLVEQNNNHKSLSSQNDNENKNNIKKEEDSNDKSEKKTHNKYSPDHMRNKLVNKCIKIIYKYTNNLCYKLVKKKLQRVYITKQFRGNIEKNYRFINKPIKEIFIDSPPKKLSKKEKKNCNNKEIIENILNKPIFGKNAKIRKVLITIFNSSFSEIYEMYINDKTIIEGLDLNEITSTNPENERCTFQTFKDDAEEFDNEESKEKYNNYAKNLIANIKILYQKKVKTPVVMI